MFVIGNAEDESHPALIGVGYSQHRKKRDSSSKTEGQFLQVAAPHTRAGFNECSPPAGVGARRSPRSPATVMRSGDEPTWPQSKRRQREKWCWAGFVTA